jgi:hypothetical protein
MKTTVSDLPEGEPPIILIDKPKLIAKELGSNELPASLLRILVNPDYYHSKRVYISGFLRVQREGNALYFSEDEDQHMMWCNALWVYFDDNAM